MSRILVLWRHAGIRNFIDVIDEASLRAPSMKHQVFRPDGKLYGEARCSLRATKHDVELEYGGEFRAWNIEAGMDIGTMRLTMDANGAIDVKWRAQGGRVFVGAEAVALRDSDVKKLVAVL